MKDSNSFPTENLTGSMHYGLQAMQEINDRRDDLNALMKVMAEELEVEPAVIEQMLMVALKHRQSR